MEAEIIHAVGVCFDVRERTGNIIHAAGVRGAVISFPPEAGGGLGFVSLGESATRLDEAPDLVAQILKVFRFDAQL